MAAGPEFFTFDRCPCCGLAMTLEELARFASGLAACGGCARRARRQRARSRRAVLWDKGADAAAAAAAAESPGSQ